MACDLIVWVDFSLATKTHSIVMCSGIQTTSFVFVVASVFAMQLELLSIGTIMNCNRLFQRAIALHFFYIVFCLGMKFCSCSTSLRFDVVFIHITGWQVHSRMFSYVTEQLLLFFYRLINFIYVFMSNVAWKLLHIPTSTGCSSIMGLAVWQYANVCIAILLPFASFHSILH